VRLPAAGAPPGPARTVGPTEHTPGGARSATAPPPAAPALPAAPPWPAAVAARGRNHAATRVDRSPVQDGPPCPRREPCPPASPLLLQQRRHATSRRWLVMQQKNGWPFNPIEVRPRFERDGRQARTLSHGGRSCGRCGISRRARRRAAARPGCKTPPAVGRPGPLVGCRRPRRVPLQGGAPGGRGASPTILPAGGWTGPPVPAARGHTVNTALASSWALR
jgi:hypothetical protein